MKKILFATTALVATAGAASAEIALTGSAEIGILGGDAYATTQLHTDIDVTFTMTGEADNGLTFGASIDLDESDGRNVGAHTHDVTIDEDAVEDFMVDEEVTLTTTAAGASFGASNAFDNTRQGGESIFVAYGGARLDMGDVDGAFDAAMQEVALAGGSIADDETLHAGYNGNGGLDGFHDGQIATFSYTASGFTGYASMEIDDSGDLNAVWGVGAKYVANMTGATLTMGAGYQSVSNNAGDDMNVIGVSAKVALDAGFSFAANYSEMKENGDKVGDHWAIGAGYEMNQIAIGVNYGEYNTPGSDDKLSGFGVAAAYDLGGGLSAKFGYSDSNLPGTEGDSNQYSLGLAMSF